MSKLKSRTGNLVVVGTLIWVGATAINHQNRVSATAPNKLSTQTTLKATAEPIISRTPKTSDGFMETVNLIKSSVTQEIGIVINWTTSTLPNIVNHASNSVNSTVSKVGTVAYADTVRPNSTYKQSDTLYNYQPHMEYSTDSKSMNFLNGNPTVYADSDDSMTNPELQLGSSAGVSYFISKVNTFTSSTLDKNSQAIPFTALSQKNIGGSPVIYMNKTGYDKQPVKVKQQVLQVMYKALDDSEMTTRDKNRIYNWLESLDQINSSVVREFSQNTSADLYGAQKVLLPFQSKIGIVLGVLTLVIALALTFSFVWDMAFLSIPFFTVILTRNNDVSLNERPFLVSQDAVLAYIESNAQSKQALTVWFKLRMKSSIIIGICLTYLISNQIWQLVSFLVDVFSRFIN